MNGVGIGNVQIYAINRFILISGMQLSGEHCISNNGIVIYRAVYNRKDVYLLDDPLSAVDPSVADQIIEQ